MQRHINLRGHDVFTFQWSKRGEALVILHGGLSHSEKVKKYLLPAVKRSFKVFAYDRTGHGRTANQKGSIAFNFQTKELIAFLEDVVTEPAHLIGVSDGAIIALMAAIARPDLVRSVVSIGGNTSPTQVRLTLGRILGAKLSVELKPPCRSKSGSSLRFFHSWCQISWPRRLMKLTRYP